MENVRSDFKSRLPSPYKFANGPEIQTLIESLPYYQQPNILSIMVHGAQAGEQDRIHHLYKLERIKKAGKQDRNYKMGEKRGTKALELWCRRITDGYTGVNVQNMTTSWKNGLAFCAMIHHFRPDLIDFDSLDENDIYGNNELAFRIAEQHLGIPALLDAEDMASCSVPDRLSILTYLSQFYQAFGGASPARLAVNRTMETVDERVTQIPESPKEKEGPYMGVRKDLCTVCGLPVFLAEKLMLARTPYHRTCFRCARCSSQLTLGNYYETEEGQYCCETCPDEEVLSPSMQNYNDSMVLSDITKSEYTAGSICDESSNDENSIVKGVFNQNLTEKLDHKDTFIADLITHTSRLRFNFISSQLLQEECENPLSPNNVLKNETLSDTAESDRNTGSVCKIEGDERRKQSDEEGKYYSYDTDLKLELPRQTNSRAEDSGIVDTINSENTNCSKLETQEHNEKELTDPFLDSTIKDTSVSRTTKTETPNPIDEPANLFENHRDCTEENTVEYELLNFKTQITECKKLQNLADVPNTTETMASKHSDRIDSIESTDKIAVPQKSLFHTRNVAESPATNLSNNTSLDDKSCKTLKNGNSPRNTVSVNLDEDYPENLNPFKSDDDDELVDKSKEMMTASQSTRDLTNPFENDEEEKVEWEAERKKDVTPPKPALRNNINNVKTEQQFLAEKVTKRRLVAPQINLNPFWSDEDDCSSDLECREQTFEFTPVPKPRTIKNIQDTNTNETKSEHNDLCTLNNSSRSLQMEGSFGGTYRKKKPAPLPPSKKEMRSEQQTTSPFKPLNSTGYHDSPSHSTPKARKTKPAPQPPNLSINTSNTVIDSKLNFEEPHVSQLQDMSNKRNVWEDQKTNKDEENRNRQNFTHMPCDENFHYTSYVNKSTEGKWKRKKGPAPPCPTPYRRKIKVMSLKDVKLELDEIELQQQGLEKQGVRLEQLIRRRCESGGRSNETASGSDVEELVLELFGLVNEKNELFRRQAELMLLRRQQKLEEEHAEVEYQIRCLMSQHESTKTDSDKQKEEALIQRLVEIVERRNEIVDCLEMDRRREVEEDRSIHKHMDLFAARNKNELMSSNKSVSERKRRKQNKLKDIKLKKVVKKDIDKDIDEIELNIKRHTKRRWF